MDGLRGKGFAMNRTGKSAVPLWLAVLAGLIAVVTLGINVKLLVDFLLG